MGHRIKTAFVLITLLISVVSAAQNSEFRATWVITWNYISATSSVEENKARIIQILENHKKANMNAVLWQVRQSGTAYYPSAYEPWGSYAGGAYPGFDPLAFVIEEAHKRGMEVHAWFNTFHTSSSVLGTVFAKHPDWICTDQSGNVMTKNYCVSPGIEAARDYTLDVAMEIVNGYDIDGLHLDYVRWNEYDAADMKSVVSTLLPDGMVSEERLVRLKSTKEDPTRFLYDQYHPYSAGIPSGYSTWGDWRRAMVTEFVRALHDSIQSVKPHVRLSVAALGKYKTGGETGWNGYYIVFQDAALWFNEGSVDQLTPMHYHWLTGTDLLNAIATDWEPAIQEGINAGRLYTAGPGSYILEEYKVWDNHRGMVSACRTKPWIDGFQFFSYASWRDRNYWDEAGSTFFGRMTHVRHMLPMTPPPAPAIAISKTDPLHYVVTVTPATAEECWYAVYRSEDQTFDPASDEIIHITFGKTSFNTDDSFDGHEANNERYYYFATAFSRFWNESLPSAYVMTDPIPSAGPEIIQSTVTVNEKGVDIASIFSFTFSKAVASASVTPSAVSMKDAGNMDIAIKFALYDSPDGKSVLSVQPVTMLKPYSSYVLRIDGSIEDNYGNAAGRDTSFAFTTSTLSYTGETKIDDFTTMEGWKDPSYSGSTTGIIGLATTFTPSTTRGLPVFAQASSAALNYAWDPDATSFLIREYVESTSAPATVIFDTSYYLQVYLFGDGSNTRFRFCIDEGDGTTWGDHEVSRWQTINWRGWKLAEWKLSDEFSVGSWISPNNKLILPDYRTDSFQFTREAGSSMTGTIYLDSYRVVKKAYYATVPGEEDLLISAWPNPFGTTATVQLRVFARDHYRLTVYSMTGQVIEVLQEGTLAPDIYTYTLGEHYGSGVYLIELRSSVVHQTIRVVKGGL